MAVVAYGSEFIRLWIGEDHVTIPAGVAPLVVISFAVTAFILTATTILLALARVRQVFWMGICELTLAVALVLLAVPRLGLRGLAGSLMSANILITFLWIVPYVCRLLSQSVPEFLFQALMRPLAAAVPMGLVIVWLEQYALGASLWLLSLKLALAGSVYLIAFYSLSLTTEERALCQLSVRSMLRREPGVIHLRELNPADASDIGRVEALFHSRELSDGAEGHRKYLEEAQAEGVNLSFGLFEDGNLVGYLLSYGFEPSGFQDLAGEAIYVEDIAVLPRYRRLLPLLFKRLANDVRKYFPGAPFEAHAVASIFSIWQKHAPFFSGLGFPLSRHRDTGEILNGQVRYLIRWEPADIAPPGLLELLARLPGHTVQVDGHEFVLKVLQDEVDWPALESCWDELLLATPGHTVFQSYDYQRLWWRHFAGDSELFIVLVVHDGAVVGIAPLQIRAVSYFGQYCHQLAFIGSRWEVDRPVFLFPGNTSGVARTGRPAGASRRSMGHLRPSRAVTDSPNLQCLEEAFRSAG